MRAHGNPEALQVLRRELQREDPDIVLASARALELLGDAAAPIRSTMDAVLQEARNRTGDAWMFVTFSLEAAVRGLPADTHDH